MDDVVEISVEVATRKLAEYAAAAGIGMREALYEEWPLLIRKVMDLTPPFKSRGARGVSDLSVGRKAVSRDVHKTMRPFDPGAIRSPELRRIIAEKDVEAFNIVAARSKSQLMAGARAVRFDPGVHLRARDARGRVPGRPRNVVVLGTDAALLVRYVSEVQAQVGDAKSGWLKALLLVGGDAPGYVARHGTGLGDVIDDHASETDPSITAINRSPWSVRRDEGDRIKSDAYAARIESIIAKTRTKLRLAAEKAKIAA